MLCWSMRVTVDQLSNAVRAHCGAYRFFIHVGNRVFDGARVALAFSAGLRGEGLAFR